MRSIKGVDVAGKKVLVRVDFNVPTHQGATRQKFRIEAARATIDLLIEAGAHVALMSHMGRPEPEAIRSGANSAALSMRQLTDDVSELLHRPVMFVSDCVGEAVVAAIGGVGTGTVTLLENVRFHDAETSSDAQIRKQFAQELAAPFDIFVGDAFSVAHRDQSSVTDIAQIIPSYAGLRLLEEIEVLSKVRSNPAAPAVFVIGGAKIETKLPLIKSLESVYDTIAVGGRIANEAIDAKMELGDNVALPSDFARERFDIGTETIAQFTDLIAGAQTVVWNGPLGKYEDKEFAAGTNAIIDALVATDAFTVVGGGETLEALELRGDASDKIDFISTGGGAMIAFMGGAQLPGISVLEQE